MHVKKAALALCMPPHSVHPRNASRGIVFSLLKNYNTNNSNKNNYSRQVNKLFNDLLARFYTKKGIVDTFEEAELKIMEINKRKANNRNMNNKLTSEEVLKSIKPMKKTNINRDMKGIVLLHHTHLPKYMSRKRLQMIFIKMASPFFQGRSR